MNAPSLADSEVMRDPAAWVDLHGDALFRFACSRVSDVSLAEDLVQDTFLAAFRHRHQYAGDSSFGTWLVAIMRRKIADHYRSAARLPKRLDSASVEIADMFDAHGKWLVNSDRWQATPAELAENAEFWQVLKVCLSGLPRHLAQIFQMRELAGGSVDEISEQMGITSKNLGVRLHRARLLLRQCLDRKWFGK